MQNCFKNHNQSAASLNSSANTAHLRLMSLRGEAPAVNTSTNHSLDEISPAYYCILPTIRRLLVNLTNYETETQVIPVIVAPHGGGKSALANHLRRIITNNSTIITGTAGLTVNNLIKHISLSSKINFTKSSDSSEYLLTSLVDQLMFSGKRVTVLIDQADALSLSCLAAIVYLASYQKNNKCLSIILFSQQSLLERLNSLISSNLHCVRIKSLPILPLNEAEVKLYTASCLKSIGLNLRSLPLNDNLISKIKRISNGLPINIQTLLAKEIVPNLNLEQPTPLASMLTGPRAISIFALILMIYCMHFYSSHNLNLIGNYTHYSDLAVHKLASFFA